MASIINEPGGRKRIDLYLPNGERKRIRLGKFSQKAADGFKFRVEQLLLAASAHSPPDAETAKWLDGCTPKMYGKLERAGLVKAAKPKSGTLAALLRDYFASLTVKASTKVTYRQTEAGLLSYFGKSTPLGDIGPAQAEKFRQSMVSSGLAAATISKRVKTARQIFEAACTWELIARNPFAKVKAGGETNAARLRFIDEATSHKVLDACPDVQWKLIFALSRWGGLRCPSEHMALKWSHVNWEHRRLIVPEGKTVERVIPLFDELRDLLLEAFEQAEEGAEYIITICRTKRANLRTHMGRILNKAGVAQWPRLYHNLRATRQTELTEMLPIQTVCAWIGNSERVARKHYLQVRDEHFEWALNPALNPALSRVTENDMARRNLIRKGDGAKKNAVPVKKPRVSVTPTGSEHFGYSPRKPGRGDEDGAKSGARDAIPGHIRISNALAKIRREFRLMERFPAEREGAR